MTVQRLPLMLLENRYRIEWMNYLGRSQNQGSGFTREESRSIFENVTWSQLEAMAGGKVSQPFGQLEDRQMIEQTKGGYRVTAPSPLADGIMILLFVFGPLILLIGFIIESARWVFIAAGLVCIVAGVLLLTVFKFRKFVAEINEEGILERVSKVSNGLIRWEEIASIYIYTSSMSNSLPRARGRYTTYRTGDRFVGITLVDLDAYIKKLNIIQKGIIKVGLRLGFAPVNIPCNLLNDADAFVDLCNNLAKKANKELDES